MSFKGDYSLYCSLFGMEVAEISVNREDRIFIL